MKLEPDDEYDVELDEALQPGKTGVPPVLGRYVPGTDDPLMTYSEEAVKPVEKKGDDDEFNWDTESSEADLDWLQWPARFADVMNSIYLDVPSTSRGTAVY